MVSRIKDNASNYIRCTERFDIVELVEVEISLNKSKLWIEACPGLLSLVCMVILNKNREMEVIPSQSFLPEAAKKAA